MPFRGLLVRSSLVVGLLGVLSAAWFQLPTAPASAGPAPTVAGQATVDIQAGDYFFNAPDVVEGGLVTVRFSNSGTETHHAQVAHLPSDMTVEQFMAGVQGGDESALRLLSDDGGAAAVAPGWSDEVALNLQAGTYLLLCVIPTPSDGIRHVAKGMIRPIVVTAPTTTATPPDVSGTLVARDFTFDIPATLPAGRHVYQVVNQGPGQVHELAVVKLAPGKTAEDVRQSIMQPAGPPPFTSVGGFQAIDPSGSGYVTLDLEAGEYAVICRVTDPGSGLSHVHLGMVKGFSVV